MTWRPNRQQPFPPFTPSPSKKNSVDQVYSSDMHAASAARSKQETCMPNLGGAHGVDRHRDEYGDRDAEQDARNPRHHDLQITCWHEHPACLRASTFD